MAFLRRIGKSKLNHHFKTIPYASFLNPTAPRSKSCLAQNPHFVIHSKPADFCYNARFFAAPVQYQKKKDTKDASGPRLNEEIRAEFVRLVTGDEHSIISRREALARARQLNHDLVEVSGKANPPVCKIMDFNKEKFLKEIREKERAKSKAESTLRPGNPKEFRFSGKTEQKDLQMKADNITRLMEDGYRVKCTAKGTANQDVLGTLTRLCALIEDIAVVESGPMLGKENAFLIVRHSKFGAPKKGGAKKLKDLADPSSGVLKATSTMADDVEPGLETNEGSSFDKVDQASSSALSSPDSDIHGSDRLETSGGTENRYKQAGPRNTFSPNKRMEYNHPGIRDSTRSEPRLSNQGRQPPRDTRFSQRTWESDKAAVNSPAFTNNRSSLNDASRREPFNPVVPSTPRPGNGDFSAPARQGVEAGVGENREQNRYSARCPANENLPGSRPDRTQPVNDRSWGDLGSSAGTRNSPRNGVTRRT